MNNLKDLIQKIHEDLKIDNFQISLHFGENGFNVQSKNLLNVENFHGVSSEQQMYDMFEALKHELS